jgi:hypothetical protein
VARLPLNEYDILDRENSAGKWWERVAFLRNHIHLFCPREGQV